GLQPLSPDFQDYRPDLDQIVSLERMVVALLYPVPVHKSSIGATEVLDGELPLVQVHGTMLPRNVAQVGGFLVFEVDAGAHSAEDVPAFPQDMFRVDVPAPDDHQGPSR